jgi:hypothetical protein
MNVKAVQRYEMLARVNAFGEAHADQFPSGTMGHRMFAMVGTSVRDVARHAASAFSPRGQARGASTSKGAARKALRKQLEAIGRTARALALDDPGFDQKFRLPRGNGDVRLLTAGRSFAQLARDRVADFVAHGLPSTFLDELASGTERFERARRDRTARRAARIGANASLKASLKTGFLAVRRLDAVVPNVLGADPQTIAAWQRARREARSRRAQKRDVESPRGVDAA